MRHKIVAIFFVTLWGATASGQRAQVSKTPGYVIVPSENVLLASASQPDSPIEILASRLLNPVDGSRRAAFQYELRNRGNKPIKRVSVWALNSTGTGGGPLYNGHIFNKPLMPGMKITVGETSLNVVALTSKLKEKLNLNGELRTIVVFVVARVEYADGSTFSAMNTVKSLQDYFVDINSETINTKAGSLRKSSSLLEKPR